MVGRPNVALGAVTIREGAKAGRLVRRLHGGQAQCSVGSGHHARRSWREMHLLLFQGFVVEMQQLRLVLLAVEFDTMWVCLHGPEQL